MSNTVVSPVASLLFIILTGPGGTGKSSLMDAVRHVLCGTVGTISRVVFMKQRCDAVGTCPSLTMLASNRMSIVPEADFDMGLNVGSVKAAVGHDSVPVQPDVIRTACTVMYGSNGAPDPIENGYPKLS